MDRAHRLGKKRTGNDVKPRPIIVKFTYYKQKQQILNSGSKFRHCPVNVSEDFLNGEDAWIDRAHRLGKRKPENDSKPRPIIVKFAYYKQKEKIIQSGNKFKNCEINVCEDYSKETLLVHKQLWKYGKEAKETLYHDNLKAITYYKIAYKRLVLTYTTNKNNTTASTFTRSFSLDYIQRNRSWFVPPNHQSV